MRVRIIKPTAKYRLGEVVDINKKRAYKLIEDGYAIISKELLNRDYKTK